MHARTVNDWMQFYSKEQNESGLSVLLDFVDFRLILDDQMRILVKPGRW